MANQKKNNATANNNSMQANNNSATKNCGKNKASKETSSNAEN